jgi:predicted nucleotidyltransferase
MMDKIIIKTGDITKENVCVIKATRISHQTVKDFLEERDNVEVSFVFHNNENKEIFVKTIQRKR